MSEPYELEELLRRVPELIVTVRGRDFKLWRLSPGVVMCRTDHESKRYTGCTLDEIKLDLEDYRPGSWTP